MRPVHVTGHWAIAVFTALALTTVLAGCVVYEPVPAASPAATYERAWSAALGAMQDHGLAIQRQDRASGTIEGSNGTSTVTTRILTQADGRVRVEVNAKGPAGSDLAERVSRSYDARMGR